MVINLLTPSFVTNANLDGTVLFAVTATDGVCAKLGLQPGVLLLEDTGV